MSSTVTQACRAMEPERRAGSAGIWLPSCVWITPLLLPSSFEMGIRKLRVCLKGRLLLVLMETGPLQIPVHGLEPGIFVTPLQEETSSAGFPSHVGLEQREKHNQPG